jgi:radical SAM superfamily enzyme YgiQ (UPF0313 family)
MGFIDWYERTYPRLTGLGLWLRGGELNTLPAAEHERRLLRVLFVRLSTYHDTARSFTHALLYQLAAEMPDVFPDLAYLPPRQDLPLFKRAGVPWLLGTQTKRGPEGFDLVGFSLSIVQEMINLPHFLRESGLPLGKRERLQRADVPLLLLGGASALYSSALWSADPLVDAVFIGESTVAIRQILELCREAKRHRLDKPALLERLRDVDGILEPDRPRPTRKARGGAIEALVRGPVPHLNETLGSGHLQIDDGCPCFCSFCAESWDRKPYRWRDVASLRDAALRAKAAMGLEELELHSASFSSHPQIDELLWELSPFFSRLGLKSQRVDVLAHDPQSMSRQQALAKTSLTIGLEGISPRLRRYLHKSLQEQEIEQALAAIRAAGARELKVFLIATGLEEQPDLDAFDDLLRRLGALRDRGAPRIIISLTPLVHFPATPLEFDAAVPSERLRPILAQVAQRVRQAGLEFRQAADLPEQWVSQVLARPIDARVGQALLRAVERTGFVYYREASLELQQAIAAALAEEGLTSAALLRGHDAAEGARRPWALVDTGVSRDFLWEQALQARAFVDDDYCLGRSWRQTRCLQCGACDSPREVAALVGVQARRPRAAEEHRSRVLAARQAEVEVELLVEAGTGARGVPRRALAVALARALMSALPALVPLYRRVVGTRQEGQGGSVWVVGQDVVTLCWDRAAQLLLVAAASDSAVRRRVDTHLEGWGQWLGLAPEAWSPARIVIRSPYALAAERYLRSCGLKYTLRRVEEGAYRLELSRDSLRKGVLRQLSWRTLAGGETEVTLVPGPKLKLEELLRQAFQLPDPTDWARISATVHGS